jgi:uracil-DNA glycosylase
VCEQRGADQEEWKINRARQDDAPCGLLICRRFYDERTYLLDIRLALLVGQYAQGYYLSARKASMTETVKAFAQYGPQFFPLPHPSWRSVVWMREHHWFEETSRICGKLCER